MPICHAIAHHVRRLDGQAQASIRRRDTEIPLDGRVEELLRELKATFCNRSGKLYGFFDEDVGSFPLSSLLRNYRDGKIDFVRLSLDALAHFKLELERCEALADAHLLLWEQHHGEAQHFYIALVEHDEALYIDGELSVQTTSNIGSMLLAARVDLGAWEDGRSSYLAALRVRAEAPLNDAFRRLLGFADGQLDLMADTREFLEVVDAYSHSLPEDKGGEVRSRVVDYCLEQDREGQAVEFEALSRALDEKAPDDFAEFVGAAYAQRGKPEVAQEPLIPSRTGLRQHLRLAGRNREMSISFDANCLGQNIRYSPEQDELVIHGLPKSLRARLMELLASGG